MKKVIIVTIFLFNSFSTYTQTSVKETEKIATFCKLWGFLKYYHPIVAKGKLDWDKEFLTRIKMLSKLNSKEEISNYYSEWIFKIGKVKTCKKCKNDLPDSLKFNLDLNWLTDSTKFTNALINQLKYIQFNRNQKKNYYVQPNRYLEIPEFDNEKTYKDSVFPSRELRLLGLSRYWNIINYFFPYKYRIGEDWNKVLVEMIPKFKESKDTIAYHLAMRELTSKINDSHSSLNTKYTNQYFGMKWVPFIFKIIDNKAIVTGFYNDYLCYKNDIMHGDVFLKVGNLTIEEIIKEKSKYIGASNEPTKLRNFYYVLFNGQTDSIKMTFERNGIVVEKTIYRYFFNEFNYKWTFENKYDTIKILNGNIGYVNLALLQPNQTDRLLKKLKDTKAIIFDVRNYPNGTLYGIANFLNPDFKPFVKVTLPDFNYPGVFNYTEPIFCGRKNDSFYRGKVILLFNEETQSHAEFTLMVLQTAPNVVGIGSQTAGADGNVTPITFPGNYITYIEGLGIYYPDGRETQRIGIVPDIEIKPTIEGIKLKKDEVLEKAIEIINEN